jgi:hypothetical protein
MNLCRGLIKLGNFDAGNENLLLAVETCHESLSLAGKNQLPIRTVALINLSAAQGALAEREKDTDRPKLAKDAAEEAAHNNELRTQNPLLWASAEDNFANALDLLAEREESPDVRFSIEKKALDAYQEVLTVRTHESAPFGWLVAMSHVCLLRVRVGTASPGNLALYRAIGACNAVFQSDLWPKLDPRTQGRTLMNLGRGYEVVGQRELGTADLEQAILTYKNALSLFAKCAARYDMAQASDAINRTRFEIGDKQGAS